MSSGDSARTGQGTPPRGRTSGSGGEALLAAYGFRTISGPGQHEALGRYLRAVLDKSPAEKTARQFDRLRRARNQDRYEAKPVGPAATEKAEQIARTLLDAAVARGIVP